MGQVETKVFQKVPPWEAAAAAQATQLDREAVQLLWGKWRKDSRSEDGKVDYREFLTLGNTIRSNWEKWGDTDSEGEEDNVEEEVDEEDKDKKAEANQGETKLEGKRRRFVDLVKKKWDSLDKGDSNTKEENLKNKKGVESSVESEKTEVSAAEEAVVPSEEESLVEHPKTAEEENDVAEDPETAEKVNDVADDPDMQQLFNLLDRDEDTFLEFSDLLAFIFSLNLELTEEEKRIRSFRFYDRAGNGAIFKEEMLHTLVVLGDVPPEAAKDGAAMPDEIENLFSLMDFAHNGKISEQEFIAATGHYRRLGQLLTIDRWENFRTDMVTALQRDLEMWREKKALKKMKRELIKTEKLNKDEDHKEGKEN